MEEIYVAENSICFSTRFFFLNGPDLRGEISIDGKMVTGFFA